MHNRHSEAPELGDSARNFSVKFSPSVCAALVASSAEEMATQSFAYHTHGTADVAVIHGRVP